MTKPTKEQVCLLSGHKLKPGEEIAECAICSQKGCVDCMDSHDCEDYEENLFI